MIAYLWLTDRSFRIMIKEDDRIVHVNDEWNNRASAEMTVMMFFPQARIEYVRDDQRIESLNKEWDAHVSILENPTN